MNQHIFRFSIAFYFLLNLAIKCLNKHFFMNKFSFHLTIIPAACII